MFDFHIIPGTAIEELLRDMKADCIVAVKNTYLAHAKGETVNPDSYFLRFPDQPKNRIIALPASIGGKDQVMGIKWISSYPDNITAGIQRASAVLILNNPETGYPFACLEGSLISAIRTAASAVLGAYWLNQRTRKSKKIAFVGAGVISKSIAEMFIADGWEFDDVAILDLQIDSAKALCSSESLRPLRPRCTTSLEQALEADIVVLATTSSTPYIASPLAFRDEQIILNISLRDIAPALILAASNVVDDIDHCLKENTSLHLAEKMHGNRNFSLITLADLMLEKKELPMHQARIFSPFGMGILDLTIGKSLYELALRKGMAVKVPNFFANVNR